MKLLNRETINSIIDCAVLTTHTAFIKLKMIIYAALRYGEQNHSKIEQLLLTNI